MAHLSLVDIWEEHIGCEFSSKDATGTLRTMVDDAYVNHIPVMTGGRGKEQLGRFYGNDFIPQMPADTSIRLLSRTIGRDRLVDEMIFSFTHDIEMPWMLPGVAPTGHHVDIPVVAVVEFRDGQIAREHIYWDQASVLKQLGLLDDPSLPVFGVETAHRALAGLACPPPAEPR